jgi:hypothetical protein
VLNVSSIVIASICGWRLLALTPTEVPLSIVSPKGQYFVDGITSFIQYKSIFYVFASLSTLQSHEYYYVFSFSLQQIGSAVPRNLRWILVRVSIVFSIEYDDILYYCCPKGL